VDCAHGEMRRRFPKYQLTLEQLRYFLDVTEESGYFIEDFLVHGAGEPLLWRHFEEGFKMLNNSPSIGGIHLTTNGIKLNRLNEECVNYCTSIFISDYGGKNSCKIADFAQKYPAKVYIYKPEIFRRLPKEGETAQIPCRCLCHGPMLFGDKIFLFCGPPVFGVAALANKDIFEAVALYTDICINWFDKYLERGIHHWDKNKLPQVAIGLCKYCWSNANFNLESYTHCANGGNWDR
jgi:hypothetical protein